jgi:hypothetical protein
MAFDTTNPFLIRPRFLARLSRMVRFFIFHWMMGFVVSAIFTVLILGFDVAGIGHLVTHVEGGWLAALVFFMLNGIVFAGAQVSVAILIHLND